MDVTEHYLTWLQCNHRYHRLRTSDGWQLLYEAYFWALIALSQQQNTKEAFFKNFIIKPYSFLNIDFFLVSEFLTFLGKQYPKSKFQPHLDFKNHHLEHDRSRMNRAMCSRLGRSRGGMIIIPLRPGHTAQLCDKTCCKSLHTFRSLLVQCKKRSISAWVV